MLVHHEDGRKAATAEAGDFFEREGAGGIGVGAVGDGEGAAQLVGDLPRSGDVAGGAVADLDDVLPDRRAAELGVEGRRTGDLGGRDVREFAHAPESFVGQVAVVLLDGVQKGDGGLARAAEAGDGIVHEGELDAAVDRLGRRAAARGGGSPGAGGGGRGEQARRAPGGEQEDDCGDDQDVGGDPVARFTGAPVRGDPRELSV